MKFLIFLLFSHGVHWEELRGAKVFKIAYDDGIPLSYAMVEVISPKGEKINEFEADSAGSFLFVPPYEGVWTLKVSDGMGHGVLIKVDSNVQDGDSGTHFMKPYQKAICGASLIWGIAGTLFFILARRRYAHT